MISKELVWASVSKTHAFRKERSNRVFSVDPCNRMCLNEARYSFLGNAKASGVCIAGKRGGNLHMVSLNNKATKPRAMFKRIKFNRSKASVARVEAEAKKRGLPYVADLKKAVLKMAQCGPMSLKQAKALGRTFPKKTFNKQ